MITALLFGTLLPHGSGLPPQGDLVAAARSKVREFATRMGLAVDASELSADVGTELGRRLVSLWCDEASFTFREETGEDSLYANYTREKERRDPSFFTRPVSVITLADAERISQALLSKIWRGGGELYLAHGALRSREDSTQPATQWDIASLSYLEKRHGYPALAGNGVMLTIDRTDEAILNLFIVKGFRYQLRDVRITSDQAKHIAADRLREA